jgi:autotransporter-associated beta strand protein
LDIVPNINTNVIFANAGLSNGNTINLGGSQLIRSLAIQSSVTFTLGGSGSLTLGTGAITRSSASSGTQTIAQPVILGANGVWDIAGSGQLIVSNSVSGAFSLDKVDSGTLTLSGNNTYTQGTTVTGGTLIVEGAKAIPAGSSLTIGSPAAGAVFSASLITPSNKSTVSAAIGVPPIINDDKLDRLGAMSPPRIDEFFRSPTAKQIAVGVPPSEFWDNLV